MKSVQDTYKLNNGQTIPLVGFGTWQAPNNDVGYKAVKMALEAGYRHIDTAAAYGNEEVVGKAIKDSGIPREDIFLTSKLWNNQHGYDNTLQAFQESLDRLGTEYLDLYLIHWPNPLKFRDRWEETNAGSWQAMEEFYKAGKIKAIGISNFRQHHIDTLMKTATIAPMVNQIRLCPGDVNEDLVAYCKEKDILLEAYSPLATGLVFEEASLQAIAKTHKTTVAKVALRWSLQRGFLPLPKSVTPKWIEANTQLFDIQLSEDEMETINQLEGCCGESKNPDTVGF